MVEHGSHARDVGGVPTGEVQGGEGVAIVEHAAHVCDLGRIPGGEVGLDQRRLRAGVVDPRAVAVALGVAERDGALEVDLGHGLPLVAGERDPIGEVAAGRGHSVLDAHAPGIALLGHDGEHAVLERPTDAGNVVVFPDPVGAVGPIDAHGARRGRDHIIAGARVLSPRLAEHGQIRAFRRDRHGHVLCDDVALL